VKLKTFNIKTVKKLLLLLIIPSALISCGSSVTTVKAPSADLSNYDTYAFLPNSMELKNKSIDEEMISETVLSSVKKQIEQEGFRMDRDNPDVLVLISTKTDSESYSETDPVYATYPYSRYPTATRVNPYYNNYYYNSYNSINRIVGYDTDVYKYKEGTLIIDLIDAESKKTIWKGITTDNIYSGSTTEAIADLIDDVFDAYPIKKM
jgi:hypothetical protein